MKTLSLSVLLLAALLHAAEVKAQSHSHAPLRGITVRLKAVRGDDRTSSDSRDTLSCFTLLTSTDENGKFMFGYLPPGTYALGCSYDACYMAYSKAKPVLPSSTAPSSDTSTSEDPLIQISVDACEGMVCHVATKNVTPSNWPAHPEPSLETRITKDWNNTMAWLNSGGGIRLRIDGANSIVSGRIEVR